MDEVVPDPEFEEEVKQLLRSMKICPYCIKGGAKHKSVSDSGVMQCVQPDCGKTFYTDWRQDGGIGAP